MQIRQIFLAYGRACAQTIILAACKITCGKKGQKQGQEKDFPVLRDSRSRYVEIVMRQGR